MKKLITRSIGSFINLTAVLFPKWNANFSFNLLCKVKRVGISDKGRTFFEQGTTTFLDINGHSAVLHQWGSGSKKLYFMHGWLSNSQRWRTFLEPLDLSEYTVYALDAPGHGMAKGKHLNVEIYRQAFMKSLEITGTINFLVCHSLGSLVAAYAYLYQPKTVVKNYVIMGSPSGMDAIFVYFKHLLGLSKRSMSNLEGKINEVIRLPHAEISMAHFFRSVKVPVLVIHDQKDRITPFRPIQLATEAKKHVTTYFTEGNDHNLKTSDVIEKVAQFIKKG